MISVCCRDVICNVKALVACKTGDMQDVGALTLWRRDTVPTDGRASLPLGSRAALRVCLRPASPSSCPKSAGTPDTSMASVLRPPLSALALWYPVDLLEAPGP